MAIWQVSGRVAAVIACAATLAALAWAAPGPRAPRRDPVSPVIFPEQRLPLRFSHVQHLTLAGHDALTCETCHDAESSRSSLDSLIPGERACAMCHDIDRAVPDKAVAPGEPPARCDACHVGYNPDDRVVARVYIPAPNLKFNHALHTERGMTCVDCHGDLAARGVGLATRADLPSMRLCLGCHDGRQAPSACVTCHLAGPGGRVQTEYASGKLTPSGVIHGDAHTMTFRTAHAAAAQNNQDYCGSCHRPSFCVECHNGVAKPMDFHGGDYIAQHAMDVRKGTLECSTCHRGQSFCTGCHSRSGVAADGRGSQFASGDPGRRFHPPGWVTFGGRGPGHHSFEAQRNIKQCASCHREDFCQGCHSAQPGSLGISPHPAGFASSRRCRALLERNGRTCLRCHVTVNEARCE